MAGTDEQQTPQPGDHVGLGRVVRTDRPGPDRAATDEVEEGSEESFPASDPPAFAGGHAAPEDTEPRRPEPR